MKAKRYTVILNDHNNTVVYTDSLERVNSRGKKVQKFPDTARIIDNSEVGDPKDQTDREEPLNEMVVIDTTTCIFFQEFLREMFQLENALVAEMGREYRLRNPVLY